jgi:hypothetical protein
MTSPLVQRLVAGRAATTDSESQAALTAELACYWARVGEFEEAERLRVELRKVYGDGRSARVSILIMIAEALQLYFKDLSPLARDRMVRANLLSNACQERRLVSLSSAWLAHIDFNLNDFETMTKSLDLCFAAIEEDDGMAECRASLVLGDAFLFCGEMQASRRWYERARLAANKVGDQAAIGAITYNRAALRVAAARVTSVGGQIPEESMIALRTEVNTAINYQAIARLISLDHLLKSAVVGTLMLERNFEAASAAISELLNSESVPSDSGELALLLADHAHCLAVDGSAELSCERQRQVLEMPLLKLGGDDRALIYASIGQACDLRGDVADASKYRLLVDESLSAHALAIGRLPVLLAAYREPGIACR